MKERFLTGQSDTIHRILCFIMAAVFCLSTMMTGTYGWNGIVNALNEFKHTFIETDDVILEKYGIDADGNREIQLLPGAKFWLYKVKGDDEKLIYNGEETYFITDQNGKIKVEGLEPGRYYFTEMEPPYGYEIIADRNDPESGRYYFNISDNNAAVKIEVENKHLITELDITKTVKNADGSDLTEEQKNKDFIFEVRFSDGKLYSYYIDDPARLYDMAASDDPGTGVLNLKHGQTATFVGVPVGVLCTVKERYEPGYRVNSNNHQISAVAVPEANGTHLSIDFHNTYDENYGILTVIKEVTGSEIDSEAEFEFIIDFDDGRTYSYAMSDGHTGELQSGGTINLKSGESVTFYDLPAGLGYTVKEVNYDGYHPWSDREDGTITAGLENGNIITFVNEPEDERQEDTGDISIEKHITDEEDSDSQFLFAIQFFGADGEELNGPFAYSKYDEYDDLIEEGIYLKGENFALKNKEKIVFHDLPEGTVYKVEEIDSGIYTAGTERYEGAIAIGYTIEVLFQNSKEDLEKETGTLVLSKQITGERDPDKNLEFVFELLFSRGDEWLTKEDVLKFIAESDLVEIQDDGRVLVTLKHNEKITLMSIPEGISYRVREVETHGYKAAIKDVEGTIIGGRTLMIEFDNHKEPDEERLEDLTVTKKVTGEGAAAGDQFKFKVTFSGKGPYYMNSGGELTEIESGYEFTLKHGENITFSVPEGTIYAVEEIDYGDYSPESYRKSGTVYGNGTIAFRNHREKDIELVVRKVVQGEGADLDHEFNFTVTINGEDHTFTLKHGEKKSFKLRPGDQYGVYEEDASRYGYIQSAITNGYGTAGNKDIEVTKTNTYTPSIIKRMGVSVEKVWRNGSNDNPPDSIYVQLYRDGVAYSGKIRLSAENGWAHTWVGLNEAYEWTVDEDKVPDGYEKRITGNASSGYIITNIHATDDGGGGGNGSEGDGGGNGSEGDGGGNGTDGSGADSGSGTGGAGNSGRSPKTGDTTNAAQFWFWCILMISSALVLRNILFGRSRGV